MTSVKINFIQIALIALLSACGNQPSQNTEEKLQSEGPIPKSYVRIAGMDEVDNNIIELSSSATSDAIDLSGEWKGEIKSFSKGTGHQIPINVEFFLNEDDWGAKFVNETENLISEVEYEHPVLKFKTSSPMLDPSGVVKPYHVELVVFEDKMIGLFKIPMKEIGGRYLYLDFDGQLVRQTIIK